MFSIFITFILDDKFNKIAKQVYVPHHVNDRAKVTIREGKVIDIDFD